MPGEQACWDRRAIKPELGMRLMSQCYRTKHSQELRWWPVSPCYWELVTYKETSEAPCNLTLETANYLPEESQGFTLGVQKCHILWLAKNEERVLSLERDRDPPSLVSAHSNSDEPQCLQEKWFKMSLLKYSQKRTFLGNYISVGFLQSPGSRYHFPQFPVALCQLYSEA